MFTVWPPVASQRKKNWSNITCKITTGEQIQEEQKKKKNRFVIFWVVDLWNAGGIQT